MNRVFAFLTTLLSACLLTGCAGYQIGNQSLYSANIQTIYIPMVKAPTFSPHMGERITEAVAKEVELRTPYKVARDNYADAVLNIEIIDYKQGINFKDKWGGPRQDNLDLNRLVKLQFVDFGGLIHINLVAVPGLEPQAEFLVSAEDTLLFPVLEIQHVGKSR